MMKHWLVMTPSRHLRNIVYEGNNDKKRIFFLRASIRTPSNARTVQDNE